MTNLAKTTGGGIAPFDAKLNELREIFDGRMTAVVEALPPGSGLTPQRLAQFAIQCFKTDQLRECTPLSIYESVLESAVLGLVVGGPLAHAYLVPYKAKDGTKRAQFQLGYRGMAELCRRSEKITRIEARNVFDGDDFSYQFGLRADLTHRPGGCTDPAKITHAYAIAFFADGGTQFEVMDKDEIADNRNRSKAYIANMGPWLTDPGEMCKKTVIRRLCKLLPMTPEAMRAIGTDDERTITLERPARVIQTTKPGEIVYAEESAGDPVDGERPVEGGMSDAEKALAVVLDRIENAGDMAALAALAADCKALDDAMKPRAREAYEARRKELAQ